MSSQYSFNFGNRPREGPRRYVSKKRKPGKKDKFTGIPQVVVRQFLERELDDYRVCKDLTDAQIAEMYESLPVQPPCWRILRRDQKICFLIGAMTKRFYFGNDTGTGKSPLSIALCLYFMALGEVKRALILVPNRTNKWEWLEEFKKFTRQSVLVLDGSSTQKWQALEEDDSPFVVETYPGFRKMLTETRKIAGKGKDNINTPLLRRVEKIFQGLVFDEVTMMKTKRAISTRIGIAMSKKAHCVFALSGTPFGRAPEDLWAQMYLVDLGETLGSTLTIFRAAYFKQHENPFTGFPDYTFDKDRTDELHRALANRFLRYEADEATLPKVVYIKKTVHLPEVTRGYYRTQVDKLRAAKGNIQEIQNAFLRMRQISSGFMGFKLDSEKGAHAFDDNPKLELLLQLIQSIKHKIVVFHDFVYSGERIAKELKALKIGCVQLYGKTKDPDKELNTFNTDPDCKVMILNNAAGGFGLNRLRVAKYGIYYESPVSSIIRRQTQRRVERQGSKHETVFIYDLVTANTMDETILDWHVEGKDLFKAIINGEVDIS